MRNTANTFESVAPDASKVGASSALRARSGRLFAIENDLHIVRVPSVR